MAKSSAPPPVAIVLDVEAFREVVREAVATADPRGALVVVGEGWGPLTGPTLRSWVKVGRLRAFRGPRQQLLAWEADVRAAVEAEPVVPQPQRRRRKLEDEDRLAELLARPGFVSGPKGGR